MNKKYRFITIEEIGFEEHGKPTYHILNNKSADLLGEIFYYPQWRQFVCQFRQIAVFNQECLLNIIDFIDSLQKKLD